MPDEIETIAQLIDLAELREIVVHQVAANRQIATEPTALGLSPDELYAPGSADDDAAMRFRVRLNDDELCVRCLLQTRNAYGSFLVDGEAIFTLPAPISPNKLEIVQEFAEQVGALAVFPYVRAAVSSLAAQLSVPASPLPLFRVGDVTLTQDEVPVVEQASSESVMSGTVSVMGDDETQTDIAEFFLDESTGLLTAFSEGQTPDVDELFDKLAELPHPDHMTPEWMVRNLGEASAHESVEAFRSANGDAATDIAHAEIDEAVAHIAAEAALRALDEAVNILSLSIEASRKSLNDSDDIEPDASGPSIALLQAAEYVRDSWDRVQTLTISTRS